MSLNVITNEKKKIPKEYENSIPDGAFYFKGIASNGELNRNGYIIRANARKGTIDAFLENWIVLYQHNPEKPIGKPLSAKVKWNELIVEWYAFDDTYAEGNIGRWLVTGLSTWHITEEYEFEHKDTKEIISEEEFDKKLKECWTFWERLDMLDTWILAVTKADLVEFSFVSLPSNKWSKITQKNAILSHLGVDDESDLESKFNDMKKLNKVIVNEVEVDVPEEKVAEEAKDVVDEVVEDKTEEKAEVVAEEKEDDTKDKVEEKVEEVKEDNDAADKDDEEVEDEENKVETVVEEVHKEQEDPEKVVEETTTDVEAPANGEEASEENLEKNMEKKLESSEIKLNEKFEKFQNDLTTSTNSKIDALEKSLKDRVEDIKMLTEAIDLIAKMAVKTNENLWNLIVNGVSSFKKEEKEVKKSSLATILEWLKS